jgi:hypothetical protein
MKILKQIPLAIIIIFSVMSSAYAQLEFMSDSQKALHYKRLCKMNIKFHTSSKFSVICANNYHHYNSKASSSYRGGTKVRIAEYNLLHPGMMNTQHKDYEILARIVNKWDVVGAVELVASLAEDRDHNERIVKFLAGYKSYVSKKKTALKAERAKSKPSKTRIAILEKDIKAINDTYKYSTKLFRVPGYLLLLNELRKKDPSWALVLSPSGEAAKSSSTQELLGFYYRGRTVKPTINEYCNAIKKSGDATPTACFPKFDGKFLGKNQRHVFSRRPFMASFKSGNFDFALLVSHVIYSPPSDTLGASILKSAFGVTSYKSLGIGVTKSTYARFAEVKVTLDFMEKYKRTYREKDLIYMGDLNLTLKNRFWNTLLSNYKNQILTVSQKSTISNQYANSSGVPTGGSRNDYDHMIFDYYNSSECRDSRGNFNAKVLSYYSGTIAKDIATRYIVRSNSYSGGKFPITNKTKYKNLYDWKQNFLLNRYITISSNYQMMRDVNNYESGLKHFKSRLLDSQQFVKTYYKIYSETLSDHMPIYASCNTTYPDDD